MLINKQKGFFIIGGPRDICAICAQKQGKTVQEIRTSKDFKGTLEGKYIHRVNSEYCYCYDCLNDEINKINKKG